MRTDVNEPYWFPNTLDLKNNTVEMLKVTRSLLDQTTFLASPSFPPNDIESRTLLLATIKDENCLAPPSYIFHSAFCCSTLLSRALDLPGKIRSLKEPQAILNLASHFRTSGKMPINLDWLHALLTRSNTSSESTVIKPTNMANNLLLQKTSFLDLSPKLFLYGSLRGFLISVIKKGEEGRFMARRMYSILSNDPTRFKLIPIEKLASLTDLQIAAMVWMLQIEVFKAVLIENKNNLCVSLHCDTFLGNPAESISAICKHFNFNLNENEIYNLSHSDVLMKNAKEQNTSYNTNIRQSESAEIEIYYHETLNRICSWAKGLSDNGDIISHLPNPLPI